MDKISTFLWFDGKAEEAANFYASVFRNSKLGSISHYGEGTPAEPGTVMTATFEINGHTFVGINGGPVYKPTPAVSFMVRCADQSEIDEYWDKLVDDGEPLQCGWVTDKFGVTWQIVPESLDSILGNPNPAKARAALAAMMEMVKLDIAKLQAALESA